MKHIALSAQSLTQTSIIEVSPWSRGTAFVHVAREFRNNVLVRKWNEPYLDHKGKKLSEWVGYCYLFWVCVKKIHTHGEKLYDNGYMELLNILSASTVTFTMEKCPDFFLSLGTDAIPKSQEPPTVSELSNSNIPVFSSEIASSTKS